MSSILRFDRPCGQRRFLIVIARVVDRASDYLAHDLCLFQEMLGIPDRHKEHVRDTHSVPVRISRFVGGPATTQAVKGMHHSMMQPRVTSLFITSTLSYIQD